MSCIQAAYKQGSSNPAIKPFAGAAESDLRKERTHMLQQTQASLNLVPNVINEFMFIEQ